MKHTDSHNAPPSRITAPARAADRAEKLRRYRRALLGTGVAVGGILKRATRDADRDRALAVSFGRAGRRWYLRHI